MLSLARLRGEANRKRIAETIRSHPGINQNQLRRRLGLNWTTINYHVRILVKRGIVQTRPQARDVRCYIQGVPEPFKPWFAALLNPNRMRILIELSAGELRFKDLVSRLDVDVDNLRRILGDMVQEGILVKRGRWRPRYAIHPELPKALHEMERRMD